MVQTGLSVGGKPAHFLVPVIVGVLGVFPAFGIGARLAGSLGGLCAAVLVGVNPLFLARSSGSDDDVWNVVLPLFVVWAAIEAIAASRPRRQAGFALLAAALVGLHAATWTGWTFTYAVVLIALAATASLEVCRYVVCSYSDNSWSAASLKRAALVIAVFYLGAGFSVMLAGVGGYLSLPFELIGFLVSTALPSVQAVQSAWWPDVFSADRGGTGSRKAQLDRRTNGEPWFTSL